MFLYLKDLHMHITRIIENRYTIWDFLYLLMLYLLVGFFFTIFDLEIADTILVITILLFFLISVKSINRELDPVRYIENNIPEIWKAIERILNDYKKNDQNKNYSTKEKIHEIINDCNSAVKYTQIAEVIQMVIIFFLLLLFFLISSFSFLCLQKGIDTHLIIDHLYYNIVTMCTIGYDDVWGNSWSNPSGFKFFVSIQATSMILYTTAYVSLFVTNLISMKPQVFRNEIREYFSVEFERIDRETTNKENG